MSTDSLVKDYTEVNYGAVEENEYIDLDWHSKENPSLLHRIGNFLWDGTAKHPKEQRYLAKLDFFLMSSAMLGYFIKSLNQSNIKTAYINGMEEYFEMNGNQYNYLAALWTIGYTIGQIPSSMILHRISARYYLGGLELCWAVLTICMIYCKSLNSMYVIRFLVGLLESGYFPGLEYLLGSNYSASEITTRSALFAVSSSLAGLVSGPLQLAILRRYADSRLPPFKWMFIFDALISVPVGIYTIYTNPNTPSTTDAWYFTEEDKLIGMERRRRIDAQLNTRERYSLAKVKGFFRTWHIWVFPVVFLCFNNSTSAWGQPTFQAWMKKDLKLGPEYYNVYPSYVTAVGIVLALLLAYTHNFVGGTKNHVVVAMFFVPTIFGCVLLSWWDIPRGLHWAAYWIIGVPTSFGQPFIFSWVNRLLVGDDLKRNFVLVVTNTLAYVTGAWVPILVWNTAEQPRYHTGFTYTACLSSAGLVLTGAAFYFTRRDATVKSHVSFSE